MSDDRRRYRRIQAPVYCRPAGVKLLAHHQPVDLSVGGVRIFSDQAFSPGEELKIEFFLPETEPVTFTAEVIWVKDLPAGDPARFDVGLKFVQLTPSAHTLLMKVLGPVEDADSTES
jgi:hypothetical protein